MRITTEKSLRDFEFWAGAVTTRDYLTNAEMDEIEGILEELYPEGIDETTLNDIFWFDADVLAEWLGFADFEEIMEIVDNA